MPVFISDDEFSRHSDDASYVAAKADEFIRNLQVQLDTVKAAADAASITAEQTCSLLEQKFLSLSSDFSRLESQNAQLQSSLDDRLSDLAEVQAQKHQLYLQSIGKDGEIERLTLEVSEVHKSKRQLAELMEQKDFEISEKSSSISTYLDRIVNYTDSVAQKEARISEIEAELARSQAHCARLSQEKELIERHNAWLNEELTTKVDSLIKLRRVHADLEEEMSIKLADAERRHNECSSSLKWNKERVNELEMNLTSLQEEFCSYKDTTAANEEQFTGEIATMNKLVELYKESSEEWSRKAGELEGVVKALETQMNQLENGYKERLEKEISLRTQYEKEAADLKLKLEKCEADVEASRKANEQNLFPLSSLTFERPNYPGNSADRIEEDNMLVPRISVDVSGTALATSLLRDGWSLAKMYAKYQEAVDALRHERLGRKESEAILQRVLYELEEKAGMILDERVEYDRMVESYSIINQKLQNSISDQANLEKTIEELKVDLRRRERENNLAQKEISDLEKQVTILLKECRDIQLRCGSIGNNDVDDAATMNANETGVDSDADIVISERLLTFKDINGLVEQNVQLRSLVRNLSNQIENKETEFKEILEMEIKKQTDEATSKVTAVLQRAEEQSQMIESLHTSVAMYKRLYEEERKLHSSHSRSSNEPPAGDDGRKDLLLLLEGSKESVKLVQDKASERLKSLEEELQKSRSDTNQLRSERDKLDLEIKFARERLDSYRAKNEQQEIEINSLRARNAEFPKLLLDFQRKVQESSEALNASEELSRKLNMEVSLLKHEKDMLSNAEKRACDEVRSLTEKVYRLQASLDIFQSAEEVREEARAAERRKQEEHVKRIEREWAEAKKELECERNNVRALTADREETLKGAMRQVEEMGKELTKALHAVSAAESRAAVAEAKISELEKKVKTSNAKATSLDDGGMPSSISTTEAVTDLLMAKKEIEKLKEEAQANKDHMLQYKSIAQVNEAALKQMEVAHENFKMESEKMKESLEDQLRSLRDGISELENEMKMKSEELASATVGKEDALASSLMEIASLKDESSSKNSKIMALETQVSALKEDLEKEHQRWRSAQDNYERQVVLQSETIKELTKTSEALAALQQQASDLRKLSDEQKTENEELKSKWETEKLFLEESKKEAEKKYNELNEQNKILHNRLEALHIQLAEKDRTAAGTSITMPDSESGTGLQNVISYLRRTKEIAETEISLLKQEKLRLQSQLEKSLKAAENAQASLHTERTNSRTLLFSDEEFKSLKFQVGEINLLRESNMQLREENRHNFEESQKLREEVQKARAHSDNLESLLRERQIEIESLRKKIEMEMMEKDHLEKRVSEVLERSRNIDPLDYDRMKDSFREMQEKMKEKESEIEEVKNLVVKQQETISKLEQDLAKSESELGQREQRIKEILQKEEILRSELDKQKRIAIQWKRKYDKEKEEFSREKQALSKQIEDLKQGKRPMGNVGGEQAMKEKEEKEHKIQLLERIVEKLRDDLRKEREDLRNEKVNRKNREKAIIESLQRVEQDKTKYTRKLDEHKETVRRLSDELEKLKHGGDPPPEGSLVAQALSGAGLDDLAASYLTAVDNFEKTTIPGPIELGATTASAETSAPDASATNVAVKSVSTLSTIPPSVTPAASQSPAKADEKEKRPPVPKSTAEAARKIGRRLVRPRLVKPDEPQADVEMSEFDGSSSQGKNALSQEPAPQRTLTIVAQPPVRKRQPPQSSTELTEPPLNQGQTSTDAGAPLQKKPKVSDSANEAESQPVAPETLTLTAETDESLDAACDFGKGSNEESVAEKEDEKDDMEAVEEKDEPGKEVDELDDQLETQNEKKEEGEHMADDVEDGQDPKMEIESEKEEGEHVDADVDADEGTETSNALETVEIEEGGGVTTPVASPARIDDEAELGEINSPEPANEEKIEEGDLAEDGVDVDQISIEADQIPEPTGATNASTEADVAKQATEAEESKQASSSASQTSTVVNLVERARQRAMLRQAGQSGPTISSSPDNAGRGRAVRGRAIRAVRGGARGGGRTGRGGSPGQQG